MERISLRRRAGLAVVLSLGLAACGGGENTSTTTTEVANNIEQDANPIIETTYKYTKDGKRIEIQTITDSEDGGGFFRKVYAECDGRFIIERTIAFHTVTGTQERTLAEEECADGRLTPEDFAIQSPELVVPGN